MQVLLLLLGPRLFQPTVKHASSQTVSHTLETISKVARIGLWLTCMLVKLTVFASLEGQVVLHDRLSLLSENK